MILFLFIMAGYEHKSSTIYYLYRNGGGILFLMAILFYPNKDTICYFNKYSFFIFMMHYPMVFIIKTFLVKTISNINYITVGIIYLSTIILTIISIICIYEFIKLLFPKLHFILNGKRY